MRSDIEQALQFIRSKDDQSIERALGLLQGTVFSFSMKVCGHPEDAEDTAQDVLLKSLPYLSKFENAQALSVWLYKVARNRCMMNRRGHKFSSKINLSLDELMPTGQELQHLLKSGRPTPEAAAFQLESAERLRRALDTLPPQYRFVLVLHDMEELSTSEVARVMGLREGTVRVRLHRARLLVRRELESVHAKPSPRNSHASVAKPPSCRKLFAALSDYLDGMVDDATCDQMQNHISDCEPCQAFLESLRAALSKCRAYQPSCPPQEARQLAIELLRKYHEAQRTLDSRQNQQAARRRG